MKFYSTNNPQHKVSLREAVLKGLAPDGGLYFPEQIPTLSGSFIGSLSEQSNVSIALSVAKNLLGEEVEEKELQRIVEQTVFFDVPVVEVENNVYSLELFHGPTLAFKDFGARFMASLLGYFSKSEKEEITVLVATSGDTGSAVAHGFHKVPGVRVFVLYPSGKVSDLQEKQFTTLGDNITALEIDGTFDDCQRLVKTAFQDAELKSKLVLTSANSINIARLIPQSFYYFFTMAQLGQKEPVVFSVPSGNFGNLTGGILAWRMGLPIHQFVASTNINDIVPFYLDNGKFNPRPSIQTISNAMDVGNPSNFARMLALFQDDYHEMSKMIRGYAFTDDETRDAMKTVDKGSGYTLDPHGAIGYLGLKKYQTSNPVKGVFLETAHPGKFREVVEETLGRKVELPERLSNLITRQKKSIEMSSSFEEFREFLLRH
ncbi:MAG: threonine synthase [Cyclobacteriaceae bacterium]